MRRRLRVAFKHIHKHTHTNQAFARSFVRSFVRTVKMLLRADRKRNNHTWYCNKLLSGFRRRRDGESFMLLSYNACEWNVL